MTALRGRARTGAGSWSESRCPAVILMGKEVRADDGL